LGLLETIEKILEKEGIAGFYRGMTPLLIGNYISYGVYFFWYYVMNIFKGTNILRESLKLIPIKLLLFYNHHFFQQF